MSCIHKLPLALAVVTAAALGAIGSALVLNSSDDAPGPSAAPRVSGIAPPEAYREGAVKEVEDALAKLAVVTQEHHDRTGEWPPPESLRVIADLPTEVLVLTALTQEDAFCYEVVHEDIRGARRRFISVTGEIDTGVCDGSRPLAEQVGDDPAATSGGTYEISDVRVVELDRRHPPRKFAIVFDAVWQGPGLPAQWACDYDLFARDGSGAGAGEFAFASVGRPLDDYRGIVLSEHDIPEIPVDVDLVCQATWE